MTKKKGGKAPQGRAKQKQKAQKASSSSSPWTMPGRNDFSLDEDDIDSNVMFRGFGGTTSRSMAARDPSIKLRHQTIAFISAGNNMPQVRREEEVNEELIAAIELNDTDEMPIPQFDGPAAGEEMDIQETIEAMHIQDNVEAAPSPAVETLFIVDTIGDASAVPSRLPPVNIEQILRSRSPALSDSSEEEIVFQGRGKSTVITDPPAPATRLHKSFTDASNSSGPAIHTPPTRPESTEKPERNYFAGPSTLIPKAPQEWKPVPEGAFWRDGGPRNVEEYSKAVEHTCDAQEGQETIEMLQAAWRQAKQEKKAKTAQMDSRRGKRGRKKSNRQLRDMNVDESDPEEAAYQDYVANLKAQEMNGDTEEDPIPDVVNHEGVKGDEQDWEDTEMTAGDTDASSSEEVIGEDLSEYLESDDDLNASDLESTDSSEREEELTHRESEIVQAEEALYMPRLQSKSDAQVAKLWAKQLELGIEADELIIDDGDNDDIDGIGDIEAARAGFEEYIGLSSKRGSKRSKRRDMSFPDASALADTIDQYGNEGFDIMDYDRPSLRFTKKGRKGKLPPELDTLSDEELKENMLNAWDNDRDKKRLKKAERERLRSEGLLGSLAKKGKADLGQKYQQGMTMDQVHAELAVFLEDEGKTTQPFPPMDKEDRKALHMIAIAFNLKSKSVGTGMSRYPVLYKTQNTLDYDETTFNRIIRTSKKGFLKSQGWGKGKNGVKPMKRSGGANMAATGLRHGEMVGAGAKEIGKESFGHKLMEKMGWTKGMALGRDGEGVLEPIEQMMRVGRAGLG